MDGLFAMTVKILDAQMLFAPLKKSSIVHLDLYTSAISSARKSNQFVTKMGAFSLSSSSLILRNTFSDRF